MRIGIDVDGVLRDFVTAFKGVVGQEYPNAQIPEMISTWKFEDEITGLSREEIREIYKDKFSKQCFQDALPFSEVVPTFWMIEKWAEREGHELIIVTSQIPQNRHYTLTWLGKYNLNPNQVKECLQSNNIKFFETGIKYFHIFCEIFLRGHGWILNKLFRQIL